MACEFRLDLVDPEYGPFIKGQNYDVGTFVVINQGDAAGTGQIDVYYGPDLDNLVYEKSISIQLDPYTSSELITIDKYIPGDWGPSSMALGIQVWCEEEGPPNGWEFEKTTRWTISLRPPIEGDEQQPGPPPQFRKPEGIPPWMIFAGVGVGILALMFLMKKK